MDTRSTRFLWLIVLMLLAATAARLYHIETQSIWFDEGWSAYAAMRPTLIDAINADATNPPLYYALLNIAARGFGDSEFALRYVSLLFGILTIPLSYQLAKQLFDRRAALGAAFLIAVNPLLWWAAQEARMYTLLAVLVLVAALAWHKLIHYPSRTAWVALWLSELALLYAHNTGPVIVLWLNAVMLLFWLSRRNLRQPDWRVWIAGQIGVAVLWSPYFVSRFLLLSGANSAVNSAPSFDLDLLARLWQAVWTGTWAMVGEESLLVTLSLAAFWAALVLIGWRQANARWLVIHTLILTIGLWLGLTVLGTDLHGRYLVMIAPLLLTAIGAGLARLRVWMSLIGAAGFALLFLTSIHFATTNPAYQHDDARGMVQYYADHLTESDTVLAWSYADRYELAYYWDRLGVRARRVTLPEGADLEAILPLLPTGGDVALNIWYTQRADYRGMMGCLLGAGTRTPPEEFSVYGMTNRFYRAPSLNPPVLQPVNLTLPGGRISAAAITPPSTADRAICLPVRITLDASVAADLKVVMSLQNGLGWEVARADTTFADAAQRTTSVLPAGAVVTAYPLLRLPYGAPPGNYGLRLQIYDEQFQPQGYALTAGNWPSQREIAFCAWTVEPGADWSQVNPSTDLPLTSDLAVGDNLTIRAHNAGGGMFRNGDTIRLALLWEGTGALPPLTLSDTDRQWEVAIPPLISAQDRVTLDWREVRIPPEAESGTAELRLPDDTVLGTYTVEALLLVLDPLEFQHPVGVSFPGVGELIGYSVDGNMGDRTQPFTLTLIWRAENAVPISYTVFAQLIIDSVIAQSDMIPAAGSRPTTGWRAGEYIIDVHTVNFHADAAAGEATLIVGLYDAATGERVLTEAGDDHIVLNEGVKVR